MPGFAYLDETWYSTRDIASIFGVKTGTVRKWVERGKLSPVCRYGNRSMFTLRSVLKVLEEKTNSGGSK